MRDADTWSLAGKVALACNILAHEGQGDVTLGHVSTRLPTPGRMLMKAAGWGLEEVTSEDVLEVDFDGRVHGGSGRRHSEYPIHAEIYRAHPAVGCVVHTHPAAAIALAARGETIRAVSHEGVLFHGAPVFDETTALIRDAATGAALARTLGGHPAVLMRNHGVVVVGETVEDATVRAILLEKAAAVQLRAGRDAELRWSPLEEIELKTRQIYHVANMADFFDYYTRRLRTLLLLPPE
ncbi:MAG: class II aldolase/adducin family protein [Thermoleophilia bacterium]